MTTAEGHRRRLRERFLRGGEKGVPDYEVVELILFGVIPRGDVKLLAKLLLQECGGLSGLFHANVETLKTIPGVGEAVIAAVKAIHEISCRLIREETNFKPSLLNGQEAVKYCRARMSHLKV